MNCEEHHKIKRSFFYFIHEMFIVLYSRQLHRWLVFNWFTRIWNLWSKNKNHNNSHDPWMNTQIHLCKNICEINWVCKMMFNTFESFEICWTTIELVLRKRLINEVFWLKRMINQEEFLLNKSLFNCGKLTYFNLHGFISIN